MSDDVLHLLRTSGTLLDGNSKPQANPAVDLLSQPLTDLGNARRFVALHQARLLYAREERRWLEWRDGRWRRDLTGAAERAAKDTVEAFWQQVAKLPQEQRVSEGKPTPTVRWALICQSAPKLRAMLELASTEAAFVVRLDDLDADPWLLGCGNGTLDLRTGELHNPDPADLITLGTDVDYRPGAPRPRWDQFIDEVFAGDADLAAFTQRAYGSALTGDTRDRVLLIEHGSRFNGKSTLNSAVQDVLGDLAHTAPIRVVMRGRGSEIPNEIAALARKRLVLVAETADGHKLDENRVKLLTGRDRVSARFLNKEWFSFLPEYKLVLFTNFKPKVDGSDGAIWDRIRLIPFVVSFDGDREDPELGAKLAAEAEGILAWLVEGCLAWQRDGLGSCDAVEQATREYRTENDVVGRFVAECCELDADHRVVKKELRAALASYCEETGDDTPEATTLGRWLGDRGVRDVKVNGKRGYRGIRLTEDPS